MKKYRVNPFCPNCGEEHCYWTITLSDEEQAKLDQYYEERKEERAKRTAIANILWEMEEKPLCVTRQFQCVVCRREFQAKVVVYQSDEIGYTDPEMIPLGEHPL